jgi:ribosomal protein S18 acetylase RimI-like enzyme
MIKLRLAKNNLHDSKFVFNLYNENVKNGFFFNKKKINFSNHHNWYVTYINNKDNFFFIGFINNVKFGYVRFKKNRFYEVSIAIKKNYLKKKLGSKLLSKSIKISKIKSYIFAKVKKTNINSYFFFNKNNFEIESDKRSYVILKKKINS